MLYHRAPATHTPMNMYIAPANCDCASQPPPLPQLCVSQEELAAALQRERTQDDANGRLKADLERQQEDARRAQGAADAKREELERALAAECERVEGLERDLEEQVGEHKECYILSLPLASPSPVSPPLLSSLFGSGSDCPGRYACRGSEDLCTPQCASRQCVCATRAVFRSLPDTTTRLSLKPHFPRCISS